VQYCKFVRERRNAPTAKATFVAIHKRFDDEGGFKVLIAIKYET